ncbi:hypothetical protein H0X06_04525 [Candidatus Dependentiae bacterium]|nr:hypothetical protein [Candidatus Dependentiae bacterium]
MKKLLFLALFLISFCCFRVTLGSESFIQQLSGLSIHDKKAVEIKEGFQSELERRKIFLTTFMHKNYDRDLVTRFIKAWQSTQKKLAHAVEIDSSTIAKLKNPQEYGQLEPSAKLTWQWIQKQTVETLQKEFQLSDHTIKSMINSLGFIDLSNCNIVYDKLGESIYENSSFLYGKGPRLVKDVVTYLHRQKNSFFKVNLSHNHLSDEGLQVVVHELKNHEFLEEIYLCDNKISDEGLKCLKELLSLSSLKILDISKNYGPTEKILEIVCGGDSEEIGELLKKKIKY